MYRILKSWLNERIKQQFIEQTTNLLGIEANKKLMLTKVIGDRWSVKETQFKVLY